MSQGAKMTVKDESQTSAAGFVQSALFARTFREGMALVEETASYLDGEGRAASKELTRDAAMSYAGASMRLTTQLMRENEMALSEAAETKYRLEPLAITDEEYDVAGLPQTLLLLIENARQLYGRIARLDADIFSPETPEKKSGDVAFQQNALREAFGGRG